MAVERVASHGDEHTTRWLAALIGAAALAMALVVVIGVTTARSEQPEPRPVSESASREIAVPRVNEPASGSIGGPDASEETSAVAEVSRPPAPPVPDGGTGTFIWPVGGTLEQGFSLSHPGIDIGALLGSGVRASRAGTVTFVGGDPCCSYGSFVIVQHDAAWSTRYAHLGGFAVAVGDEIGQGDLIGVVGLTGRTSGPHVHFEILHFGVPVNPLAHLPGGQAFQFVTSDAPATEPLDSPAGGSSESASAPARPTANPQPTPAPALPTASPTETVILLAANYLVESGEYEIVAGTCGAGPAASNQWFVTCDTRDTSCGDGPSCVETRLVCLIEDPLAIWAC